eukprot:TRINITY_DN24959_c0_g1_i1.p1 TRINITY_DN24959_c0_g1~~TRINITY_DN24959_c0_g1_i1.p1  ORF type:complete len:408 (+),score=66.26 TRINITY_DN24959_c0_g1_i1:102-1325(+)
MSETLRTIATWVWSKFKLPENFDSKLVEPERIALNNKLFLLIGVTAIFLIIGRIIVSALSWDSSSNVLEEVIFYLLCSLLLIVVVLLRMKGKSLNSKHFCLFEYFLCIESLTYFLYQSYNGLPPTDSLYSAQLSLLLGAGLLYFNVPALKCIQVTAYLIFVFNNQWNAQRFSFLSVIIFSLGLTIISLLQTRTWEQNLEMYSRHLREKEEKEMVLGELQEGILIFGVRGNLLFSNSAAWTILGDEPKNDLETFKAFLRSRVSNVNIFANEVNEGLLRGASAQITERTYTRIMPDPELEGNEESCDRNIVDWLIKKISRKNARNYSFKFECTFSPNDLNTSPLSLEVIARRTNFNGELSLFFRLNDISKIKEVIKLKTMDEYKDRLLASVTHEPVSYTHLTLPTIYSV